LGFSCVFLANPIFLPLIAKIKPTSNHPTKMEYLLQHAALLEMYWIFRKEKQSDDYDQQITSSGLDRGPYRWLGRRTGDAQDSASHG
jgi:hypothetical protein